MYTTLSKNYFNIRIYIFKIKRSVENYQMKAFYSTVMVIYSFKINNVFLSNSKWTIKTALENYANKTYKERVKSNSCQSGNPRHQKP